MPPDDPLFTQPTATETPAVPSPVDVGALIDERLAPVVQGMQQINGVFKDLQERAASAPPPTPVAKQDDWQERFFQDTKGAIDERINEGTRDVVAASAATVGGMVLDSERTRVDAKYGEGAFDKYIWPELEPTYNRALQTNPAQLHNKTAITNAVKTIMGDKADTLFDVRASYRAAQAEAATKQEDELVTKVSSKIPSNLTGGFRASKGSEGKLTPEHRVHMDEIARETGTPVDEARMATMMGIKGPVGTTYAAWEAANAKLTSKGGK